MRTLRSVIVGALLTASLGLLTACGPQAPKQAEPAAPEAPAAPAPVDLVQTSSKIGIFSTFSKAVGAADLGATLSGPGPYTVFVPEDSAFAKIPAAKLNRLLANKAELARVLKYHVVPGRITAADMAQGESELTTVDGSKIKLKVDTEIHVNGVKVVQSHIDASNGVIHVIDTVLTPPPAGRT